MKYIVDKSKVDIIFIIITFGTFMICALFVVLFGTQIYKNTISDIDRDFAKRTSVFYISEKIRRYDYFNGVRIDDSDLINKIILSEKIDDTVYDTYIYTFNGYLKEITIKRGNSFELSSGQNIIKASKLLVRQINPLLIQVCISPEGEDTQVFYVSTKIGGEYE